MKYRNLFFLSLGLSVRATRLNAAEADPKFKPGDELLDAWRIAEAEEIAAEGAAGRCQIGGCSRRSTGG